MLMVTGKQGDNPVELFDDGADVIEFREEGHGSTFETLASANETLRNASQSGITEIQIVELAR